MQPPARVLAPVPALTNVSVTPGETGPNGFAAMRVTFENSLICDNGILIADYAQQYGIKQIFVPVTGDDITSLLGRNPTTVKNLKAMSDVATVYFVSGDPSWLASPGTVPPDAASLGKIAHIYPKVAGILYTVDPEQSTAWDSSQRKTLISSYLTLVQTLLSQPYASNFKETYFVADADWGTFHDGGPGGRTMFTALQAQGGVTGIDLLAPGNTASTQMANISAALPQLTKPFWLEASTSPYAPNDYHGVSPGGLQYNLWKIGRLATAQNANYLAVVVNGWNDRYTSLQGVLPQPPTFNGTLATGRLVPDDGKVYIGASANPLGNPTGTTPAQTAEFEAQIGRKLAFNVHFYGFTKTFPGANEDDDIANGRIPVIAWNCGDSNANVAAGNDDATLINQAQAFKAFKKPVLLRWFWEMNLASNNNGRTQCYDPGTDLPGGYFAPSRFIAAWRHIHDVFVAQNVTNVIWLWCVADAHGDGAQYYPGDDVVDWIGMDNYDTAGTDMQSTFAIQIDQLSQFQNKPLMIAETGAHPGKQLDFLNGGAGVLRTQFPQVRAFGYLDARGSTSDTWVLSEPNGINAFTAFANSPHVSAMAPNP